MCKKYIVDGGEGTEVEGGLHQGWSYGHRNKIK